MPRRCAVPNCLSNSNSKHNTATYISTFLFPSEEEKFKVWMDRINANCNSQISQVKRSTAICIKHFEDKYIVNEARVTRTDGSVLTFPLKRPRLTADAVPTIFSTEKGKKIVRKKYVENSAERYTLRVQLCFSGQHGVYRQQNFTKLSCKSLDQLSLLRCILPGQLRLPGSRCLVSISELQLK